MVRKVKYKIVAGKKWVRCNGAPALWCTPSVKKRLQSMQLEDIREKMKKGRKFKYLIRRYD